MLFYPQLYRPYKASPYDMCKFHTPEYINFLKNVSPQTIDKFSKGSSLFNAGDDWLVGLYYVGYYDNVS